MASTTQLRKGDMFAEPTDLIVIPCDNVGSITYEIARKLQQFDIELPKKAMPMGEVEFKLFKGASSIATYVAYAASVDQIETTPAESVSSIAEKVARFAAEKTEIRNVTFPLLGAGMGGLQAEATVKALLDGLERAAVDGKVFNIFAFKDEDFERICRKLSALGLAKRTSAATPTIEPQKKRAPLRVFISYTRSSDEHQQRVVNLGTYLRQNGVDARLDVWHLRPGMDIPQWMSNELDLADRVVLVCNQEYAARADGRIGGVGWEIRLVVGDLYQSQQSNPDKHLPVVFDELDAAKMPRFLRNALTVVWPDPDPPVAHGLTLLKTLYKVYDEAPPLGAPPSFVLR